MDTQEKRGSTLFSWQRLLALLVFGLLLGLLFKPEIGLARTLQLHQTMVHERDSSLWTVLRARVEQQPFDLVAFAFFSCAIIHTFFTHKFTALSHAIKSKHHQKIRLDNQLRLRYSYDNRLEQDVSFVAEMMHLLGEVEAVFGLWLVPLVASLTYFFDWETAIHYVQGRDFTEPMFVVVIMSIAASRPVVDFSERCLGFFAKMGGGGPGAWWLSILTLGPLLASFITEPAAMTLCAMLLQKQFYNYNPKPKFAYATLGLLFTNVSVGGVLTNFAAPPVLMVAKVWNWSSYFMLTNFGWKAALGIIIANLIYFFIFRSDFKDIAIAKNESKHKTDLDTDGANPIPLWITLVHLLLVLWTVLTAHYPAMFIAGFLFFLAFYEATAPHQHALRLRGPVMVGCFLAALVTFGGLQEWWTSAIIHRVGGGALMAINEFLTSFNDNAAITYLSSLVPDLSDSMKYFAVAGAVAGGGLTVIANAPNPAGWSLLEKNFKDGISHVGLFLGAALPTISVTIFLAFF